MSSTHRHLLLDFFWQVISGPPCIILCIFLKLGLFTNLGKMNRFKILIIAKIFLELCYLGNSGLLNGSICSNSFKVIEFIFNLFFKILMVEKF
jgi:hypothetical protein